MDTTTTPASALTRRAPLLDNVSIATPCSADWDAMSGDERVRFCGECSLHVYNLSAMTRDEAEALLAKKEGRLCVRLYKRADGTVITQDCPRGLERVRRRMRIIATAVAGMLSAYVGWDFLRPTGCPVPPLGETKGEVAMPIQGAAPPPPRMLMGAPPPRPERQMMGDVAPEEPREKLMGKVAAPNPRLKVLNNAR